MTWVKALSAPTGDTKLAGKVFLFGTTTRGACDRARGCAQHPLHCPPPVPPPGLDVVSSLSQPNNSMTLLILASLTAFCRPSTFTHCRRMLGTRAALLLALWQVHFLPIHLALALSRAVGASPMERPHTKQRCGLSPEQLPGDRTAHSSKVRPPSGQAWRSARGGGTAASSHEGTQQHLQRQKLAC